MAAGLTVCQPANAQQYRNYGGVYYERPPGAIVIPCCYARDSYRYDRMEHYAQQEEEREVRAWLRHREHMRRGDRLREQWESRAARNGWDY